MAAHHHHHKNHCCSCCCQTPPPPPPPSTDPLLQSLLSLLIQQSQPSVKPHFHSHLQSPTPPHDHHHHHHPPSKRHHQNHNQNQFLLHRISYLESSLHHLSSSPPPSFSSSSSSSSSSPLREAAARTIQAHFRSHLVRRSQSLRHLRALAAIKSNLTALRSPPRAGGFSQKASTLLVALDSIQSRDSMIREGKRAIRAEILALLYRSAAQDRTLAPKSKKKVSFATGVAGGFSDGNDNCRRRAIFEGQNGDLAGFNPQPSDEEKSPRSRSPHPHPCVGEGSFGRGGSFQGQYGNLDRCVDGDEYEECVNNARVSLGLDAPFPVQMERRGGDVVRKVRVLDSL